nr:putative toxin [Terrimonas ginsenosidimutans]
MEESHYYPFGLIQAGISSKALEFGNPENKLKYNGIEYEKDLGLEVYDAQLRELDGQIGRWWQIDPKTEDMEMWSPYASNYNNPIRYSDPLGDEGQACCGSLGTRLWGGVKALGGMLEMAAGAAGGVLTSWTGVGAVVGGAAVVHGADNTAAGFTQLFTGKETKTFTEQGISKGLQATGVSEQTANTAAGYIDGGLSIALSAGSGSVANTSKVVAGTETVAKTPAQLGKEGMTAAGIEQNTTRIPSASGKAAYRVPDGLTTTTLSEVKNVAKQSYTSQLQDYVQYAQQNGLKFDLYVRPTTQLSQPLMDQVNKGNIFLNFLPVKP